MLLSTLCDLNFNTKKVQPKGFQWKAAWVWSDMQSIASRTELFSSAPDEKMKKSPDPMQPLKYTLAYLN